MCSRFRYGQQVGHRVALNLPSPPEYFVLPAALFFRRALNTSTLLESSFVLSKVEGLTTNVEIRKLPGI